MVSVHALPFQVSECATFPGLPPAPIAEVCVPPPAKALLPLFKSATSVQPEPFQDSVSVFPVVEGFAPPKTKPAVLVPAPAANLLAVMSATSE